MLPNIPLEKALAIALAQVKLGSASKHQDYQRTIDLARDYKAFITGKDMEYMYRRYDPRESKESFEQAVRLTNPLTPSVCAALTNPLLKLANVIPKTNTVSYGDDIEGKKAKELRTILDSIYGDNDLTALIGKQFLEYGIMDPNAFVLWTFENFDNRYEKPQVFHTIIPSEDVYNFEYRSDVLQWLWIHKNIQYLSADADGKPVYNKGDRWVFYTADHHIVFEQVRSDIFSPSIDYVVHQRTEEGAWVAIDGSGVAFVQDYWMKAGASLYRVNFYNQKAGRVPAYRLGYKHDAYTMGRTCVNLWHAAYEHLMSLVKLGREKDLSFVLHAFPQKLSYAPPCKAPDCIGGQLREGGMCGACKGTGKQVATTASDHIELALPPLSNADRMIDLEKLVKYASPPVDILTIIISNIKDTVQGAFKAVYNSDVFLSDSTAQTATGQRLDMQSVYDTLQAPSRWFSAVYMDTGYIVAAYNSMDADLSIVHRLARNFKFESISDILYTMKEAKAAGASTAFLSSLNTDLTIHQFQDDPYQLNRVQTMTRFDPFPGKTDDIVAGIIAQKLTTMENAVLWSNMPQVFDRAEMENPVFYELSYPKQREIVDMIVGELLVEIEGDPEPAEPVGNLGVWDDAATSDAQAPEPRTSSGDNDSVQGPFTGERGGKYWLVNGKRQYSEPE